MGDDPFKISSMTRITNHSDSLRLDGAELERLNELYDEAKRGRHRDVIDLREDLKHAPQAPSAEHRDALEREGRESMVQAADAPAWSRHFARLRDHMAGVVVGQRGPDGEGYDDTVYYFCLGLQSPGLIAVFLEMKIKRGPLARPDDVEADQQLPLHYIRFEYMAPRYLMPDKIPFDLEADLVLLHGVVFKEDFAVCYHEAEDCWQI
jgi:hypothetical protein